jgi:hypothetical protein
MPDYKMSDYGLSEDYFPYKTRKEIENDIQLIINKRNHHLHELDALQREGVVWGNIVEEYRKMNDKSYGPYYRLTYYTDKHGHKPKPDYIPANEVTRYQQKIDNYVLAQRLKHEIDDLENSLRQARRYIEQLARFLAGVTVSYEQPVLPGTK